MSAVRCSMPASDLHKHKNRMPHTGCRPQGPKLLRKSGVVPQVNVNNLGVLRKESFGLNVSGYHRDIAHAQRPLIARKAELAYLQFITERIVMREPMTVRLAAQHIGEPRRAFKRRAVPR